MVKLRRLVLVRHGETVDHSSERLIGSGDPPLSELGRLQMRQVAKRLHNEVIDLVVASPLRRSWEAALILAPGHAIRIEADFRERHFGRWEGLTLPEIEAADPIAFRDWQAGNEDFEFPGGEPAEEFRARIARGLDRLLEARVRGALAVLHKGVIREIVKRLTGEALERERPVLAEAIVLTRLPDDRWILGRRSSNPPALEQAA